MHLKLGKKKKRKKNRDDATRRGGRVHDLVWLSDVASWRHDTFHEVAASLLPSGSSKIERRLVPSLEIDSSRERRHRARTATDEDFEHATRVRPCTTETRAEIAEVR